RQIYNRINQKLRFNIAAIGFDPSRGDPFVEPIATDFFSVAALLLKETCHVTNKTLENRCTYWTTTTFYVSLCCCYTNRTECAYKTFKFPSQKKPNDTEIRACATGDYYVMKRFGGNHEPKNASDISNSVKEFVQRTSSEFCAWTYTWDPSDGDLCNKRRSYLDLDYEKRIEFFKRARPCESQTAAEHLLLLPAEYKKSDWLYDEMHGYMCPIFYNFAHPGRRNTFLQLAYANNFWFVDDTDKEIFLEDGCRLVEVDIKETGKCSEKLFEEYDHSDMKRLLILLCAVTGNPLGIYRSSYPDAELKKNISAKLIAAKAEFPTCKNDFKSLDFESLSELVQQYNFTFGAVSIDDNPLRHACHESELEGPPSKCVQWNSTTDDEYQHFACCCPRHFSQWLNPCYDELMDQLKILLNENVIAKEPHEIMSELEKDPLTKCDDAESSDEGHAGTEIKRPCARNDGCYTAVHARDVPTSTQHKEHAGCVSEYAPDAKKRRDTMSDEIKGRFYRICRVPRNQGECFAVLGTEDAHLADDVNGPEMVCCCGGRLETAQKCDTSQQFGMKIGDFH
ncbi:hypothetical protein AAVH_40210, partial [Aphelenchoides avenae]